MLSRFLKESLIYGASNVFARGIALALVPFYTRTLAPADLGVVDLVAVIGNMANLLLAMEISQAVARYFPQAAGEDRVAYASTALWFTIASYSVVLGIGLLAAKPFAQWIFDAPGEERILRVALPALWANGVLYFLQNQLRWQLQARAHALASLIFAFTSAGLAVVLIVFAELGLVSVFWGQLFGALGASAYCALACAHTLRARIDRSKLLAMLSFSAPLMISSVAAFAAAYADRIIIKELISVAELGIYGVAQRIASTISLALAGFQATITPLVTHFAGDSSTPQQLERALRYFLAIALPTLLGLGIFSRELIVVFATPEYQSAHALIPVLAGSVLLAGMYVFVPGLWLARKTGTTMAINLAAAAISVTLNLVLIPRFGLQGAAAAAVVASGVGFCAYVAFGRRYFPVSTQWTRALMTLPLLVILIWVGSVLGEPSLAVLGTRTVLLAFGGAVIAAMMLGPAELRLVLARVARKTHQR